jgi:hypothetical protein
MNKVIYIGVKMFLDELTNVELARLNISLSLGDSPKKLPFYDKIAGLFTENDGTKMHSDTEQAFHAIVIERLENA